MLPDGSLRVVSRAGLAKNTAADAVKAAPKAVGMGSSASHGTLVFAAAGSTVSKDASGPNKTVPPPPIQASALPAGNTASASKTGAVAATRATRPTSAAAT